VTLGPGLSDISAMASIPLFKAAQPSLKGIEAMFNLATLIRAREYLAQGRVLEVKASADLSEIRARVQGSGNQVYQQDINLINLGGRLMVRDYCSCPVSGRCKHVAAVLLSLLDSKPNEEQRIDLWLSTLDGKTTEEDQYNYRQPQEALFVLSRDDAGISVEIRSGKLNAKGSYGKGAKVSSWDLESTLSWSFTDADGQIIRLLQSAQPRGANRLLLQQDVGFLALGKMLASGRCFFEESRIPLSGGEVRRLQLDWQQQDGQHKQLRLSLAGLDNWELLPTVPPTYVDLDFLTVGLIDTEIATDKLIALSKIPPVANKDLERVSLKLAQHFSASTVPTPIPIVLEEVDCPLLVRLTLTMASLTLDSNSSPQPIVKAEFVYGPVTLAAAASAEPITLVKQADKRYQIRRRCDDEYLALDALAMLGLFALAPGVCPPSLSSASVWSPGLLPDAILDWVEFSTDGVLKCRKLGFEVILAADFDLQLVDAKLSVDIEDDDSGWFSLALTAEIDGEHISLLPVLAAWLSRFGEPDEDSELLLPGPNGRWIKVQARSIKPLIGVITELFGGKDDAVRLPRSRAMLLNELSAHDMALLNAGRLSALADKLNNFAGIAEVPVPAGLDATLRPYQQLGLNWLCFLKDYGLGGILADDMGLGKTLQTLAFILQQQQLGLHERGSLIVCPTSLVGNWAKEAARFTPALKLVVVHGNRRKPLLEALDEYDLVITTYPLMVRDHAFYEAKCFDHLVLDEAQQIKNAQAKVTQVINGLKAGFRLCLSGTPLENHLGELKSLLDFALPGLLGQQRHFNQYFRQPIEKHGDGDKARELNRRIAPFLLRRTKDQVVSELPPKTVMDQVLALEKDQRNLYESIRLAMEKKLRELFASKGVGGSHIEFLEALLKLRQVCCDARLVKLEQAQKVSSNAKLAWLTDNLPEMVEEGRKILIFSQFTGMLGLIEDELKRLEIGYCKLTGQTRKRQPQIDAFQEGDTQVFLISLKAGGTGLNLTAADTVIHYDPWWNPAVEKQATDRAHRIGQQKPVFVYRLIAEGTVEEKIQQMQQHKQSLSDSILAGDKQDSWQGDAEELLSLFR
jgi:hypothetical protein